MVQKMKLGLINSAWVQTNKPLEFGLRETKRIGFDTVDLFIDPLDTDRSTRAGILRECQQLDLPIVSLCCVAVGLSDFNPSVRRFHIDRVQKYLEMAAEYHARNVLLVIGEYIWNQEVISASEQWRLAVEATAELGRVATGHGVEIAIELEPFPMSLINDIDSMVRFLDDVGQSSVKANIDISHLHLAGVLPEQIRKLHGRAAHVHISDCDGIRHGDLPPGRGVVPFAPYLAEIKNLDMDGVISIELEYSPDPEQIVLWVEEAYTSTDRLLKNAALRG